MKYPQYLRHILIFAVAIIATAESADSGANGTWLYPDPNTTPTFNYLDTLNASWASDFSTPWLHLWCGIINGNSSSPVLGELYNKTAPATGSLEFPLNYALEPFNCHFELSRQAAVGLGPPFAMSGTFNVAIESNAKPVTWSQNTGNSSTASTGTNASKDPGTTASPTPSSTTTAEPQTSGSSDLTQGGTPASGSSGLSSGAKVGIGVGVALGVLALIAAAAAFFLLRRRKHARTTSTPNEHYRTELPASNSTPGKFGSFEMPTAEKVHEKDGTGEIVHEKDSAPVATQTIGELEAPRY